MRMTIGKKLGAGFGAVILLTLLLGGASYWTIGQLHERIDDAMSNMETASLLELRISDHLRWMNALSDQFILNIPFEKELDPHRCKFGQWYDSFKSDDLEMSRILASIDEPHKKLHAAGAKIKTIFQEGGGQNPQIKDIYSNEAQPAAKEVQEKIGEVASILKSTVESDIKKQYAITRIVFSAMIATMLLTVILAVAIAILVSRSITRPVAVILNVMRKVGGGDLTQNMAETKARDEIGDLAEGFRNMITGFRAILLKLQEATSRIASSGSEILATTHEQVTAAREQSSAVAETTSATKELSMTSEQVGESIKKVAQVSAHALAGMAKIKETTARTNLMLASLGEKSQKIGKIAELIDDVANQTNLLAVNASIEAARAGDQGRGFTVVADEIRNLADSTARSTKDITALIELIQHEMSNAIMSMEQSVQNVDEEARLAQQTTEKAKEIAMSTHQQVGGSKQIAQAMMSIDDAMKQIVTGAQQSQTEAKQLTELAADLKQMTSKFKL